MNGNLIDTNIIINLLNGNKNAIHFFDGKQEIYIPVIVAGELFYGAYKSSKINENLNLFTDFLSNYPILDINQNISEIYSDIKSKLIKKGFTIPENDIWIAAIAKFHKLTLITFDSHFCNIDDLDVKPKS